MATHDIPPGTVLGDFVVGALIGTGGMSSVYRARQRGVGRDVALKVLAPALAADAEYVARFWREAGITRDLEHPALLPVYAAGEAGGVLYLATRLVVGTTLAEVLAAGPMAPDAAVELLQPIAGALDHAHARGVVHRDIKPSNVLLDIDGRPFLADFGIAKSTGTALTATGRMFGTPRYMAPEQAKGSGVGFRSDLYSLACTAFEMLTGRPPFDGDDPVALLMAHTSAPIPQASALVPALGRGVDAVLTTGLAKRPGDRFRSATELVEGLAEAVTRSDRTGWSSRRTWFVHPNARVLAGAVALAVLVALTAALVVWPRGPADPVEAAGSIEANTDVAPPPPAPAELASVPRGARVYQAPLNGTSAGFASTDATRTGAREAVRYVPGALELEALAPGGETYTQLDLERGVTTYLAEMDVSVRPGSEVELCWSLRWEGEGVKADFVCVDTASGEAAFSVFRRGEGKQRIGGSAVLHALPTGRQVHLAVTVRRHQFALYEEGRLVLEVVDDQVPLATTLPGIEVESTVGTGLVRIEGLRLFRLADA